MRNIQDMLKSYRKYILFFFFFLLWNIAFYLSFAINKNSFALFGYEDVFIRYLVIANICFSVTFLIFKLYDKIWRYADIEDFFYAGIATFFANFMFFIVTVVFYANLGIRMYVLLLLISTFLMIMFRLVYRINKFLDNKGLYEVENKKRLMIVGGGETAVSVLREIAKYSANQYIPICIVDDDREKVGRRILGIKIEGSTYEIPQICEKMNIEEILFSITAISPSEKKRILDMCAKTGLKVRIVPNIYEVVTSGLPITSAIRRVRAEDLLGREPIIFDHKQYGKYIVGKTVLVTGGGGSIGSELCRQIVTLHPQKLIILDIYENGAYDIQQEILLNNKDRKLNLEVEIASIRDETKIDKLFKEKNIDVVFHAAAHKHVPLMETNPEEAVKNNVFGTMNLVKAADKYKVKKFVQISTDKAVNPTNFMGATKRICEMIIQFMDKSSETEFVAVRFGNVLGSNGSVVPLFEEQIKNGGPVTVTHPEIIRYFMTIPEAVSLVLTAGGLAQGGEIFVLDMGEPVKIKDLAENLIRLSGFIPNEQIRIEYTGLRPGEKLYEELLLDEEGIKKTKSKKIYIGNPIDIEKSEFESGLEELKAASEKNDVKEIERIISFMVPTFHHKSLSDS